MWETLDTRMLNITTTSGIRCIKSRWPIGYSNHLYRTVMFLSCCHFPTSPSFDFIPVKRLEGCGKVRGSYSISNLLVILELETNQRNYLEAIRNSQHKEYFGAKWSFQYHERKNVGLAYRDLRHCATKIRRINFINNYMAHRLHTSLPWPRGLYHYKMAKQCSCGRLRNETDVLHQWFRLQ